jgi:predicted nucleic acid-binding protein
MRIALDTNILAYAAGVNGAEAKQTTLQIIRKLPEANISVPVQVLGELFRVLVRKAGFPPALARTTILHLYNTYHAIETSSAVLLSALDLAAKHTLAIWDAMILSAAAEADCSLLLSEDMHDGFTWRGVTVANPFAAKKNELLAELLE